MAKKEFDLSVIFRIIDKATKPIQKIGDSLNKFSDRPIRRTIVNFKLMSRAIRKSIKRISKDLLDLGKKLRDVGKNITGIGKSLALRLTAPILAMGTVSLKSAIDFETAFTGVKKTVEGTATEFKALEKDIRALALRIPVDTTELSKIAEVGGQLGVAIKDIPKFTETIAKLGASTDALTSEEAAIGLARFRKITNSTQADVERMASTIVDLGNNVEVNEREILELGLRLAAAGTQAGLSTDEILGFSAALGAVGIPAEAGGTAFSAVMFEIQKAIGKGGQVLQDFADVAGKTTKDFAKDFKTDAAGSILAFTERLAKLEKQGVVIPIVLDRLGFEGRRIARVLLSAAGAGDSFRKTLELSSKAFKENTALTEEANKRFATTASRLKVLLNRVKDLAITFGNVMKPALDDLIKDLEPIIDNLRGLDKETKKNIITFGLFAAAFPPLLIALGFLVIVVGSLTSALGFLGISVTALGGFFAIGLTPVLILLAALVTLAVLILNNWKVLLNFFVGFGKDVFAALTGDLEPLKAFFADLFGFIKDGFLSVKKIFFGQKKLEIPLPTPTRKRSREQLSQILAEGPGIAIFPQVAGEVISGTKKAISKLFKSLSTGALSFPARLENIPFKLVSIPNNAETINRTEIKKTKTDINIKVSADKDTTATIGSVRQPNDIDTKINIATDGFIGAAF